MQPIAPYIVGSDTSYASAIAMQHKLNRLEGVVLAWLRDKPGGATDEQMQDALEMNPNTQRPRRISLVSKGLIVDSGVRRRTGSGRMAVVWAAV